MKQRQAAQIKSGGVRQAGTTSTSRSTPPVRQVMGNRSLLALLHAGVLRAKLAVNQSGGMYEREADRAAEQAVRRVRSGGGVMKQPGRSPALSQPPSSIPGMGNGRPLSRAVRGRFEDAFGWDFSGVRIHTGRAASEAADSMGARAFTAGRDIVFGSRVENPESGAHSLLLAHELAHVVQQGRSATSAVAPHSPAASLSAAPQGSAQTMPLVTAIVAPAELGVGRSITATATVAPGAGALTWTPVGALPAGVTITPSGRRATIRSAAAPNPHPAAGNNFTIQAARTAAAGDSAPAVIRLVGVANVTMTAAPAFANRPITGGAANAPVPPAAPALGGVVDPNRGGLAGNTVNVVVVTAPAGRAITVTMPRPLGSAVAGLAAGAVITPGSATGNASVRVTDNATRSSVDAPLVMQSVPLRLRAFGASTPLGPYGSLNPMFFAFSDASGSSANRPVAEIISPGGRDDLNFLAGFPPNLAPIVPRTAAANAWQDQVVTPAGASAGAAGDANLINVNHYVGPGVAAGLPRISIDRQGFHFQGWGGAWSDEFDNGIHRVTLFGVPGNFRFRTEHIFPGATATWAPEPYTGPPLIVPSAITLNTAVAPSAPLAAGGLAADGVAVGGVTVNVVGTSTAAVGATVVGRIVNWTVLSGPIAFVAPATGAVGGANTAAGTVQAGLTAGNFSVRAADSVFPNRRVDGRVRLVPVVLRGIAAPVRIVPAGTLVAAVNVTADPGGRNVNWAVDPAAAAAGVTVAPVAVAGPAAAALARGANVTRPPAFTGRVTVTAVDSIRAAARASIVITFR